MNEPASVENPHAGQGSVMLDIGGDIGALVVIMPAEMKGVEVEIRPVSDSHLHGHRYEHVHDHADHGDGVHHPHVAVVIRPVEGHQIPSLVFPELFEGRYELYLKGTQDVRLVVEVLGGRVATAEWPG